MDLYDQLQIEYSRLQTPTSVTVSVPSGSWVQGLPGDGSRLYWACYNGSPATMVLSQSNTQAAGAGIPVFPQTAGATPTFYECYRALSPGLPSMPVFVSQISGSTRTCVFISIRLVPGINLGGKARIITDSAEGRIIDALTNGPIPPQFPHYAALMASLRKGR